MALNKNNNGHKVTPELPVQQKESYKLEGKWPPPAGITILTEEEPSISAVLRLLDRLSIIVKPSQRKFVEHAQEKLIEHS